jgi:hypothetical protein
MIGDDGCRHATIVARSQKAEIVKWWPMLKAGQRQGRLSGMGSGRARRPSFYFAWGCFRDLCKAPAVALRQAFPQCGTARPQAMVAATPRMLRDRNTL